MLFSIWMAFSNLLFLIRFVACRTDRAYRVGYLRKARLAMRVIRNRKKLPSLSSWQQHLLLIEAILKVPKSLKGDIVECGCYNGASTANLSLACALAGRRLFVCDSFEGLPQPTENEKYEIHADVKDDYYVWEQGEYSSTGGLDGVRKTVEASGDVSVCTFVKGFFCDTLKDLDTDAVVLVFEDADLASSVEDCLRYLWPKLQEGCRFYCHEPWSVNVVALFYNEQWWKENLNASPPGFSGSGDGITAGLIPTRIGYAKKFDPEKIKAGGKKIVHAGSRGFDG